MITANEAVREKHSGMCACFGSKTPHDSFCRACLMFLPQHMRDALQLPIGGGYERAYETAKRCIVQRRTPARLAAPGTTREPLERRRRREAKRREK